MDGEQHKPIVYPKNKKETPINNRRERNPVNGLEKRLFGWGGQSAQSPNYNGATPSEDNGDRSPRGRKMEAAVARVCGLGLKPKLVIPCRRLELV
uniref:Uncharacterized protein n=1 Tax=Arundo donax TaxID=35708 RepID=A0A0A9H2U1_ARUDO